MIELSCACGQKRTVGEDQAGQRVVCPGCGQHVRLVCAETLEPGAGMGDFDASLVVQDGPGNKGERFALGGVADIAVGKQAKEILLPGNRVSRQHCVLRRKDFGPSRWAIVDNNSTNGLFVNGTRVKEAELNAGDELQIGEYVLRYEVEAAMAEVAAPADAMPLPPLPPVPAAASLPPVPRATVAPRPGNAKEAEASSNDGWSTSETQFNKMGTYIILVPSIIGAILASGSAGIDVPVQALCVVVGICGVIGGIVNIWGRGPIWAGSIIGLVMSLGGLGAVAWWIHGRTRVMRREMIIAFVVGAAPGFGLQVLLQKVVAKGRK